MTAGPQPRHRLYTAPAHYLALLGAVPSAPFHSAAVAELEEQLGRTLGVEYAITMPMARTGIYFALRSLIRPGQRVVLAPYTISEVVNMVLCAGGVPVFADIERRTCNIDAAEVERLLDGDTGAVLATHFYGLACDISRIRDLCRARGVALVEDAAQAFGTTVEGRAVGTFGDAGVYSFGLYKNVTTFLGGAVVAHDKPLADVIRAGAVRLPAESFLRLAQRALAGLVTDVATHRMLFPRFTYPILRALSLRRRDYIARGMAIDTHPVRRTQMPERYLHRMRPFQARLARRQLGHVQAHADERVRAARAYHEGLQDIPELVLPPMRSDGSHTYQYYAVQADDRVALVRHVLQRGRDIAVSHHKNCAEMECFAEFRRSCPNATLAAKSVIYLPTYPGYGLREVDRTVAAIRSYYGR